MRPFRSSYAFPQAVGTLRTICTLSLCFTVLLGASSASHADPIKPGNHAYHQKLAIIPDGPWTADEDGHTLDIRGYEPEFLGADRSIIGRVDDTDRLENNRPGQRDIDAGKKQFWKFPQSQLETGRTLYVTFTICDQPQPKTANPNGAPEPLHLYISTDPKNQNPDRDKHDESVAVELGYGSINLPISDDVRDIYFGVTAPAAKSSAQYEGSYNYQLTGSTDELYVTYDERRAMAVIDSDTNATLLSSEDDTEAFKYSVFVHPQEDAAIWGLSSSFCGLERHALVKGKLSNLPSDDIQTSLLTLGAEKSKQQFHVKGLNGSTAYYGILAIDGNPDSNKSGVGVNGGGGKVWKTIDFTTKASGNCAVIYNLTFCSDVAYAVPANPDNMTDLPALAQLYDRDAEEKYQNFSKSVQQVPCNTTSTAKYSLARTCDDCAKDYKTWLCAITIPRCEDFSVESDWLMPRAVSTTYLNGSVPSSLKVDQVPFSRDNMSAMYMNSSRNTMIDMEIRPGPYKELLPCEDLCYEILRSCPASLSFACPLKDHYLYYSYGRNDTNDSDSLRCNYPGAAFYKSSALALSWDITTVGMTVLVVMVNVT